MEQVRVAIDSTGPGGDETQAPTENPSALLAFTLREAIGVDNGSMAGNPGPLLIVVTGDIDPAQTLEQLEAGLGQLPLTTWQRPPAFQSTIRKNVEVRLKYPVAQEQLGYVAVVPGPREQTLAAAQMTLYVLQHGYEGRLGKKAISDSGLVYYIETEYDTDGANDWISLNMGVDPDRMPAMQTLLGDEILRLSEEPPTGSELDEARNHLVGRCTSAAQSNLELTQRLISQWLLLGQLESCDQYRTRLEAVSRDDVLSLLPALTSGSVVSVMNPREISN
jgi:predicted Zn-dependent peptidase